MIPIMPTHESTTLVIARHGETEANLAGVHQGRTDSPLTSDGHKQAVALGIELKRRHPKAVAIYTSPLGRAQATAAAVAQALGLSISLEPNLVEGSFGEWEGATLEQMVSRQFWHRAKADPDYAAPGGESFRACGTRAAAVFRQIAARHTGHNVIAVTHQGPVCQGIASLVDSGYPGFQYGLRNGGFREIEFGSAGIRLGNAWRARPVDL